MLGLPETTGLSDRWRSQPRERHRTPKGFRAAGVAAGLKTSGGARRRPGRQRRPGRRRRPVSSPPTGSRPRRCCWSQQVAAGRRGPRRGAQLRRRQRLHRPGRLPGHPRHRRAHRRRADRGEPTAAPRRRRGRGLLDRPDRRAAADGRSCCPASRAAVRGLSRDGGAGRRRGDHDHRHPAEDHRGRRASGWTVGGMAKGAGMLAPGHGHHARACSPPTRWPAPATLDAALRAATRVTFDRVDSDGCMSTNDTVLLLASGASGIEPTPDELTAAVTAACHDLAQQLLADAEGATKHIAIEVRRRGRARTTRSRSAGRWPATTWSRRRCSATTRTGAGSSPRSAPPPPRSSRTSVDVAVNGVWVCRGGAAAEDRSKVDLTGRDVHDPDRPARRATTAATIWTNDLSARVRARELGVLDMSARTATCDPRPGQGRAR